MKNVFYHLFKNPTFISITTIIIVTLGIPLIIYQSFTFDPSESLGITIEVIFLVILFVLLIIDRFLLLSINNKKLSVIEVILIAGYLTNYYFTHDRSFSIG